MLNMNTDKVKKHLKLIFFFYFTNAFGILNSLTLLITVALVLQDILCSLLARG